MSKSDFRYAECASGGTDTASGGADVEFCPYAHENRYGSRAIFNNSGRYEEPEMYDDDEDADDVRNDFADLLNIPSDCNFFQFKSEKNWDGEAARSTFSCQKFFNLNLEVLSHSLECLPFYERVLMDRNILPESDIERCDRKASEAMEKYKEIREKFMQELEENEKPSKSLEDLTGIKWEQKRTAPKATESDKVEATAQEETDPQASQSEKFWLGHITQLKEKGDHIYPAHSSSSDESLELWLDTVLED